MANGLTKKQELFVKEYLVDLNATKAAERAGYSTKTARQQGSLLLTNVDIDAAIQRRMDKRAAKVEITADWVLGELKLLAQANMMDYIDTLENGGARVNLSKLTRDQAAAIGEITVEEYTERSGEDPDGKPIYENVKRTKFKLSEKRGALELLGRHLKLFTDKVQVEGEMQFEVSSVKQKLRAKLAGRTAQSSARV